ncbi:MAG: GHKL domain-containing protein [Bacillota bacterium]
MNYVLSIVFGFTEGILAAAVGTVLTGMRPRLIQLAAVGLITSFGVALVRSHLPFGTHQIIAAGLLVAAIWMVTRTEWQVAAVAGLLGFVIYGAWEQISVSIFMYVTGYSLTDMFLPKVMFLSFFPDAVVLLSLIWLCLRFNFRLFKTPLGCKDSKGDWRTLNRSYFYLYLLIILPVMLLLILSSVFLALPVMPFSKRYLDFFWGFMALAVLVLAALTPFQIQAVSNTIGTMFAARKHAESLRHIGELLRLIRRQHHDFNHHLQVVYGLLETGCFDEARQYIKRAYEGISIPSELIRTDNLYVTALLYTKLAIAEARQIKFEPVIQCSLQGLPLNVLEIGSVFGNLVDNAFEEVQNAPPEKRLVQLEVARDNKKYVIRVANAALSGVAHQNKLFQAGYSTKEGHAGLGLTSVRDIVRRYGGEVEVGSDGARTVFTVKLPVGESPDETRLSTTVKRAKIVVNRVGEYRKGLISRKRALFIRRWQALTESLEAAKRVWRKQTSDAGCQRSESS